MSVLSQEKQSISSIVWPDDTFFRVGVLGVTRIEAYDEFGDQCMVPWLAVYKGDTIRARVPANQVLVNYEEATNAE